MSIPARSTGATLRKEGGRLVGGEEHSSEEDTILLTGIKDSLREDAFLPECLK